MAKARQNIAALGALAPVALGCALFDASAAEARKGDIEGLRNSGESQRIKTDEAAELGRAYLKAGDTVRALEMYRQVVARDPNDIDALNGIAVCYDRLGQFDVSRAYYEAALGMEPHSPMLLNNYGYSLFLQGDMDGARRFLGLAAASEDPAIQTASLRVLARIDATAARAPTTRAVQTAEAAPSGPRIVRTSNHEQRLMLGGTQAPPQVAATLSADVAAIAAPVTRFTEAEEQAIFAREEQLVRAEAIQRLAALQLRIAVERDPVLPSEMQAVLEASRMPDAGSDPDFAGFAGPADGSRLPALPPLPGHALADSDLSLSRRDHMAGRDGPTLAILPSGILVQRTGARSAPTKVMPAAEPLAKKRSFQSPFQSDLDVLNGFAARLHGQAPAEDDDLATKLALLQDLIDRTRSA